MALFDFLKRKQPSSPKHAGPSPHYAFAHYALRQIALAEPLQFLAIAASPDAGRFFDVVLKDVAEQCGRPAPFHAASIKVHPVRVNNFPCAVVEMPEPSETAEAFMVALVVPVDMTANQRPDPKTVSGRFFTLEKGFTLTNEPRTVLGEWDLTTHFNYGDGPPATVERFVTALAEHV